MSKKLSLNDTHSIKEYKTENENKLREELELYKQKCQELEETVNIHIFNFVKDKVMKV